MSIIRPEKLKDSGSLKKLESLSRALGLSVNELKEVKSLPLSKRYTEVKVPKIDGTFRIVYKPDYRLRKVQRRINNRIFKELVSWPYYLFGSVPSSPDDKKNGIKRDYVNCAKKHCNAKTILKVDIKNFFDNIHRDLVEDIFKNFFKYKGEALEYLVDLCCNGGYIVQGALTSSYIATLCLYDIEFDIVKRAERKNLVYTRLVDDITISSKVSNFDFSQIKMHVEKMMLEKDLPLNLEKTKIHHISTEPLSVHGLRVSFDTPRLASDEVKRIRASLSNLIALSKKNNSITSATYRKEYDRCMGKVNKLGRVEHNKHPIFLNKLKNIRPLPSEKDACRALANIHRLEVMYKNGNSAKYSYIRSFHLASYRLIILSRTACFSRLVNSLRVRLKRIEPKLQN